MATLTADLGWAIARLVIDASGDEEVAQLELFGPPEDSSERAEYFVLVGKENLEKLLVLLLNTFQEFSLEEAQRKELSEDI